MRWPPGAFERPSSIARSTPPMTAAPAHRGDDERRSRTRSTDEGATAITAHPSQAMYMGSNPSTSHRERTSSPTGRADSSIERCSPVDSAHSHRTVPSPPRVQSLMHLSPSMPSRGSSAGQSGAQSLVSPSTDRLNLAAAITAPCRPIDDVTTRESPSLKFDIPSGRGLMTRPNALPVKYTPSTVPAGTTLVSPAASLIPSDEHVAAALSMYSSSSSAGKPSSIMTPSPRKSGDAPLIARSLAQPQTHRCPRSPPGNLRGETVKPSTVMAYPPGSSAESSSSGPIPSEQNGLNRLSTSSWLWRPPLPCPSPMLFIAGLPLSWRT
ncbi:MAG: hypothetical protein BWY99_01907 [Synergistetes bacterium ADurb.BinA166]|nr:MAG: hypothetical protein BWY99_01907 [Synergistetes bacterium ADurb.BinA166]